jgi:NAD(P)-dependent dehydrogenase (short-subunit alcohol dehydrogenase family)
MGVRQLKSTPGNRRDAAGVTDESPREAASRSEIERQETPEAERPLRAGAKGRKPGTRPVQPAQSQDTQPGTQREMVPEPVSIRPDYAGSRKLAGRVALITGGDSGIGRAVALHFAREGAHIAFVYLDEHSDAAETERLLRLEGVDIVAISSDLADPDACRDAVAKTIALFGRLDILVNNAAQQYPQKDVRQIDEEQLDQTFRVNVYAPVFLVQAALDHLEEGGVIINTSSVTAAQGSGRLVDYSATKGAIEAMTFSLAQQLVDKGIRVNAVAPGPVWTPLIPASFTAREVADFGSNTLLGRPAQPAEIAPAYVFLASQDSSYVTGQVIHVNGGRRIGN